MFSAVAKLAMRLKVGSAKAGSAAAMANAEVRVVRRIIVLSRSGYVGRSIVGKCNDAVSTR